MVSRGLADGVCVLEQVEDFGGDPEFAAGGGGFGVF